MEAIAFHENLTQRVIAMFPQFTDFESCVAQFDLVDYYEGVEEECLCGNEVSRIVVLKAKDSGAEVKIGTTCINRFALDEEVLQKIGLSIANHKRRKKGLMECAVCMKGKHTSHAEKVADADGTTYAVPCHKGCAKNGTSLWQLAPVYREVLERMTSMMCTDGDVTAYERGFIVAMLKQDRSPTVRQCSFMRKIAERKK